MTQKTHILKIIEKTIQDIDNDLRLGEAARNDGVHDANLTFMRGRLNNMKDTIERDQLPEKHRRYPSLSRLIVDSWPLGTNIGNAVGEIEAAYRAL